MKACVSNAIPLQVLCSALGQVQYCNVTNLLCIVAFLSVVHVFGYPSWASDGHVRQ